MKYVTLLILFLITACSSTPDENVVISTEYAPEAVGSYSQGVMAGNTLYTAGQIAIVPETGELSGDDIASQTRQVFENLGAVVDAAGMLWSDVVRTQVYLTDMEDYREFNEVYSEYFPGDAPARAAVEVSALPLGAKVEIMATAVREKR